MASAYASRLKRKFAKMPAEFFETLTFGELKIGQKFISLPLPGDNSGHGGFLGAHHIFTKTRYYLICARLGPNGEAVDGTGRPRITPHPMPVILVE